MTEHTNFAVTPRDRFLEAAQKELIAFERREREFTKRQRKSGPQNCSYLSSSKTNLTARWEPDLPVSE
jgi:hypothetical protein